MDLEDNVEGALAYVLGFVSGIILYVIEKDNDFIRFHALQSTITFLGLFIVSMVFSVIPLLGVFIGILSFIAWIIGIVKAYQGELYKFPVIGDIAEQQIRKS